MRQPSYTTASQSSDARHLDEITDIPEFLASPISPSLTAFTVPDDSPAFFPTASDLTLDELHQLADATALQLEPSLIPGQSQAKAAEFEAQSASVLQQKVKKTLDFLSSIDFIPLDFFSALVSPRNSGSVFTDFQKHLFRSSSKHFESLLDVLWSHPKANEKFMKWMYPIGLCLVLDRVSDEMDNAKEHFSMTTTLVTPEFLSSWNIQDALSSSDMKRLFPTWSKILDAATQSKRAEKNQVRTPELASL